MHQRTLQFYELLVGMTNKELHARYKNTFFGFLWLIINPILQMLVIGFIFPFFIKNTIDHYYVYLFSGLLMWNFFSLSLSKATSSIVNERALITKAKFPREIIPLSIIMSGFIHYLVAMIMFFVPILLLQRFTSMTLLLCMSSIGLLMAYTIGASLLTSALNVRYRDMSFFVQAGLIIWFYATPIVYTLTQIPEQYRWLWQLNPLTSIVQLMQASVAGAVVPDAQTLTINIVEILLILFLGIIVFANESKNFDDWV